MAIKLHPPPNTFTHLHRKLKYLAKWHNGSMRHWTAKQTCTNWANTVPLTRSPHMPHIHIYLSGLGLESTWMSLVHIVREGSDFGQPIVRQWQKKGRTWKGQSMSRSGHTKHHHADGSSLSNRRRAKNMLHFLGKSTHTHIHRNLAHGPLKSTSF